MPTNEPVAGRISLRNLRTEYLVNPLGIEERRPRLSWQVAASGRNVMQGAYQVQVAQTAAQLNKSSELLWDSGKVASDRSISIQYGGPEAQSRQRYYWRVRVWDQVNNPSDWSESAWWEVGLLEEKEWSVGLDRSGLGRRSQGLQTLPILPPQSCLGSAGDIRPAVHHCARVV